MCICLCFCVLVCWCKCVYLSFFRVCTIACARAYECGFLFVCVCLCMARFCVIKDALVTTEKKIFV